MVRYDTMAGLASGAERLREDSEKGRIRILAVKDRLSEPTSGGWADLLVNICACSSFF